MRQAVLLLVAVGAGFLLGRLTTDDQERAGRRDGNGRTTGRMVEIDESELHRIEVRADQATETARRNEELQREIATLKTALEPTRGERREDGTIVGGAKWEKGFVGMARGFMDSMLAGFLKDAKLTAEQERRVREEFDLRAQQVLQSTADFTNGDIDADVAYQQMEAYHGDAMKLLRTMFDEDQMKVYRRYEKVVQDIVHSQIVHTELVSLKKRLGLDQDQAAKVQAVLEERYRTVQKATVVPLPQVFFTPIRRSTDQAVYDRTATAIRGVLRTDQILRFDKIEAAAPTAAFDHRNKLDPKWKPERR